MKNASRRVRHSPARRNHRHHFLEPLETRTLLAGVTLVTHGLGGDTFNWLPAMTSAIATQAGITDANFVTYTMKVTDPGHNGGPLNVSISRRSGSNLLTSDKSPEILIILDWSDVAGDLSVFGLFGGYSRPTSAVGAAVAAAMADPAFLADLGGNAIASLPMHLIGHSRGASLVGQIAYSLAQRSIWVDQLTTFDPVPSYASSFLYNDPVVKAFQNVIFFDNYYQTQDKLFGFNLAGFAVSGAHNVGSLSLPAGYNNSLIPIGPYHNNVHLYYHGTINTASNAKDNAANVNNNWYANNIRATTGFAWTRLAGGEAERPRNGVGSAFGGSASRSAVSVNKPAWANIAVVNISATSYTADKNLIVHFKYQSPNERSTVTWYIDSDQNPFNGNEILLTTQDLNAAKNVTNGSVSIDLPFEYLSGDYHLLAVITNPNGTRQIYASSPITDKPNPYPKPTVSVTASKAKASENKPETSGKGTYTFTRTGSTDGYLTVSFTLTGTAANGDYIDMPTSVTFLPGQKSVKLDLIPIDNGIADAIPLRTVILTLDATDAYNLNTKKATATITIADNSPIISVKATKSKASETKPETTGKGTYTFTRTGSTTDELTVYFTLTGTAANGDYIDMPTSVTFLPGQKSVKLDLIPIPNTIADGPPPRTVILTLIQDTTPSYRINAKQTVATVSIADNAPIISVKASKTAFTFTRTGSTAAELTVQYTLTGTAANGEDFTMPVITTFLPGQSTITITPLPLLPTRKTVILTLTRDVPPRYHINPKRPTATLTLIDP